MQEVQKKLTISELINYSNAVQEMLLASEGELTENIDAALTFLNSNLTSKADGIAFVLDSLTNRVKFLAEKEAELYDAKKRTEKALDALKSRVLSLLEVCEGGAIEGEIYTLKMRKSGGKVVVHDETLVPPCYQVIKQSITIDKKEILQDLKKGIEVDGCELVFEPTLMQTVNK